jgi:hypothetical protein
MQAPAIMAISIALHSTADSAGLARAVNHVVESKQAQGGGHGRDALRVLHVDVLIGARPARRTRLPS